ncbi:MAG: hypothetical protein H0V12_07125, partial [Chloroflexi bacterium]|nr:hypothetical protein [Chloroflexota bacterium]
MRPTLPTVAAAGCALSQLAPVTEPGMIARGTRFRRVLVVVTLGAALIGLALPAAAAQRAQLQLRLPAAVAVGQPITATMTILGAAGIAGYESQLLFDRSRLRVTSLVESGGLRRTWGRDATRLGPVETPSGITFGAYSCPVDCIDRSGARRTAGASGTLELVTIQLVAVTPGPVEIRLGTTRFVDTAGRPVTVAVPRTDRVTVKVGRSGRTGTAPTARWALGTGASRSVPGTLDVTRDGAVTAMDTATVVLGWLQSRESGDPCRLGRDVAADVNRDGCIDIGDVQAVAGAYGLSSSTRAALVPAGSSLSGEAITGAAKTERSGTAPMNTAVASSMTFVVDATDDADDANYGDGLCATAAGACTLRAAIVEANWHAGPDRIEFAIPGTGVKAIKLSSALPIIHDETGPVTIDGYSQPGASPNTDQLVSNAQIRIEIVGPGEASEFSAFRIVSPGNTIRGLALYKLWRKIWISGGAATSNVLEGNFVGTDAAGTYLTSRRIDSAYGAIELDDGASGNRVGGTALADRNVISGNPGEGIHLRSKNNNNRFVNNIIGLDPQGTKRLQNWIHGIDFNFGSSYNVLGGVEPGERNVVSGNIRSGVEVSHG